MEPGIYTISNAEYHASAGISRSAISELKKSPLHYWDKYINPEPKEKVEEAEHYILGKLLHTLVLEPHLFKSEYIISEKFDRRTKVGKASYQEFQEKANGKMVIDNEMANLAKKMAAAVLDHPKASALMYGAEIEKSFFWIDEDSGLLFKARPDIWNPKINVLCDLKTTADANYDNFRHEAYKYDYHIQAAMQMDGVLKTTGSVVQHFVNIAVPKTRPHTPYIFIIDDEAIEKGRCEYKDAGRIIKKCTETNRWNLDRETPISIGLKHYHLNTNPFNQLLEIYKCQQS